MWKLLGVKCLMLNKNVDVIKCLQNTRMHAHTRKHTRTRITSYKTETHPKVWLAVWLTEDSKPFLAWQM